VRYALVTGSTKGIGLAIASELVSRGYFIYMHYANDDKSAQSLKIPNDKYKIIKTDLSSPAGATVIAEHIISDGIRLDCVVLNAGMTCRKPFGETSYDEWNAVMNVNVSSSFLLCQKLYSHIVESGSIVLVGSDMGIHPHAVSGVYSVSKAASHMLARSLVKDFAKRRIRVNAIAPGFIDTEWQKEKPQELREKITRKIALKRFGTPEEVANACMFIVENSYMNGAVLQIDGGYDFE
jgi:3-oxoacyl-[acyl-carrier protein] reductase